MTLIALTLNNIQGDGRGYPVMMADILVSNMKSKDGIPTPTFIDGTAHIYADSKGLKPFTLMQKLYIVNDRLCVALAGHGDQMALFLGRMKKIYGNVDFDDNSFLKYIDAYPAEESDRLSAIILKAKRTGKDEFDFEVRGIGKLLHIDRSVFGTVVAGGGGAADFLEVIESKPTVGTDIKNTDAFLAANESMIGHFLGYEIATAKTLKNLWGAGYEMIVFDQGKFTKLKEYTVVLMVGKFGRDIEFEASPFSTMMVSYQDDDVLVITTFANNTERVFSVPTILDERDNIVVQPRKMEHGTLLLTYILTDVDNNTEIIPAVAYPRNVNQKDQTPVVIERMEDGRLRVHKDGREDKAVLEFIESMLKQV